MTDNIIIIGTPGVGKTTIGKLLADSLDKDFIDLDRNIEIRCGVDIETIFAIESEQGFRKRESFELNQVITEHYDYVLSVGGGCVIEEQNRNTLYNSDSFIVQLYADVSTLVERLSKSINKRPLLNNVDVAAKITSLYKVRRQFYDEISDIKFDTSGMRPSQVVEGLIKCIYR